MKKETFITVFYRKCGAQTPDCIPPSPPHQYGKGREETNLLQDKDKRFSTHGFVDNYKPVLVLSI